MKIVVLNISTWKGIASDAQHFYGTLTVIEDERVSIDDLIRGKRMIVGNKIDIKNYLNKEDNRFEFEGDYVLGFNTKEQVVLAGKQLFNELKMENVLLLFDNRKFIKILNE
jgi:hypothetical protein